MMGSRKVEVLQQEVTTKGREKIKWVKKYATLNRDNKALILSDKKLQDDVTPSDVKAAAAIRKIALSTDVLCIPLESEEHKKTKRRFLIRIMSDKESQPEPELEVTLSVKSEEDKDDLVKEINDIINEQKEPVNDETITLEDLDAIIVETDALNHLNKTRPKFQGRRRPQKRPRKMLEDIDENAEKKQKTDIDLDSPVKSACTDGTDGASSSGLGLDSETDVISKDPSSSCSHDNPNENDNSQGRKYKRKSKKPGSNQSPVHTEVRRRPKIDRGTSLLKRLSNRLSQVFGHGPSEEADKIDGPETSPSSSMRRKSEDSLDVHTVDIEIGGNDVDENLSQISTKAERLLSLTKSLQDDLRNGVKTGDLVQTNLKYIRLAMRHLEKSLEHMSLVESEKNPNNVQEE
ncbi:uncharacterized protein [Apostichopus japonicus]|uniref:uncharacterized protein n=1 Tax=Stichopus japonicus TaxID=307972 RepID=UPI003AB77C73